MTAKDPVPISITHLKKICFCPRSKKSLKEAMRGKVSVAAPVPERYEFLRGLGGGMSFALTFVQSFYDGIHAKWCNLL